MNNLHRYILEIITHHTASLRVLFIYGRLKRFLVIFIPGDVKRISTKLLRCRPYGFSSWVRVNTTPHYRELLNPGPYNYYLHQHGVAAGYPTHCTVDKFIKLSTSLDYLVGKYRMSHILVVRFKDQFYIIDGIHRASILANRKNETISIRVVPLLFIVPFRGFRQFLYIARHNKEYRKKHNIKPLHILGDKIDTLYQNYKWGCISKSKDS